MCRTRRGLAGESVEADGRAKGHTPVGVERGGGGAWGGARVDRKGDGP